MIFEVWNETLLGNNELIGRGAYLVNNLINQANKHIYADIQLDFENGNVGMLQVDL